MAKISHRYFLEHLAVLIVIAVLTALMLRSDVTTPLSRYIYDRMIPLLPVTDFSDIAIVGIDKKSLAEIGAWPWDRRVHAHLIEQLNDFGSKAIVLDLTFSEPDRTRPESDGALMRAFSASEKVFLPVHFATNSEDEILETMPHMFFAQTSAGMGHVNAKLDDDGVVRGIHLRTGIGQPSWKHLTLVLNEFLDPEHTPHFEIRPEPPPERLQIEPRHYRMVPFKELDNIAPPISASDVIYQRVSPEQFKDKVVFVGATASGLGDLLPVPSTDSSGLMPGVEVNANIFSALRANALIKPTSVTSTWAITFALVLATPLLLPLLSPRWAIPFVFAMLVSALALSYVLLAWQHKWLPIGPALLGTLLTYPLWTWRRLESSLAHIRRSLRRLSVHDDLNLRLIQPAPLNSAITMLEITLPVESWRLALKPTGATKQGGEPVSSRKAWQGSNAERFLFTHDKQRYELTIIWEKTPTAEQQQWVRSVLRRCQPLTREKPEELFYDSLAIQMQKVRTQEARQDALTHFFDISLTQMSDGVVISDAAGELLYVNAQASAWLNINTPDTKQTNLLQFGRKLVFSREQDNWLNLVATAIKTGRSNVECKTFNHLDIYLDILRTKVDEQTGEILILTMKDISEVKQTMRTKSEMLDFLSHDLRSPMVSLLALTEQHKDKEHDEATQELLKHTRFYAQRSLTIAEQFLQLARAESMQEMDFRPVDMLEIVEHAIEQTIVRAKHKDQELSFHYAKDDDVWVNGHAELLERAVENLLSNAVKYSPKGSTTTINLALEDDEVVLLVSDEGVGIEPEFIQDLFKSFARSNNIKTKGEHGAGLGLRFVEVVAQRHHGSISVQETSSKGSTFKLSLPHFVMEYEQ